MSFDKVHMILNFLKKSSFFKPEFEKSSILDEIRKIIKFGHIWKNHHFLPKFENIFLQKKIEKSSIVPNF